MSAVALRVELIAHTPDPENLVATAARVCYAAADLDTLRQKVSAQDQSAFVRQLIETGHLSTVEHISFTFGVQGVSRALLAQLTRHRLASFSVQSQRYVQAGAGECFDYIIPPAITALGPEAVETFQNQMQTMQNWYDDWCAKLGGGNAREDARFVLPNAAGTRLLMTMNARELMHLFALRCCNRAQWEIRAMAWEMLRLVTPICPTLFAEAGPGCVRGACPEGPRTCKMAVEVRTKKALMNGQ